MGDDGAGEAVAAAEVLKALDRVAAAGSQLNGAASAALLLALDRADFDLFKALESMSSGR